MKVCLMSVAIVLLASHSLLAQPAPATVVSKNSLDNADENIFELADNWRYHPGDDPDWADPDFDDSGWDELDHPQFMPNDPPPSGWHGMGWWRLRLEVDSTLWNVPLTLMVKHIGALEMYVDGEMVHEIGRVSASPEETEGMHTHNIPVTRPLLFQARGPYMLAIRFVDHRGVGYNFGAGHPTGFRMALADPPVAIAVVGEFIKNQIKHRLFVAAAALTIALLHLLFFAFYRKLTAHLYYALFTLGAASFFDHFLLLDGHAP